MRVRVKIVGADLCVRPYNFHLFLCVARVNLVVEEDMSADYRGHGMGTDPFALGLGWIVKTVCSVAGVPTGQGELGIELPDAPNPVASYLPSVRTGNLVFISGQGTVYNGARKFIGKVGEVRTKEEGYQAAYICGLNLLAQLKRVIGDLDQVKKIVHIKGYVACSDDFYEQPAVVNGASDLMVKVFGNEIGRHSRCAIGVNVLPNNITVEVEMVVETI
jgi:enamine deaminase RidA (YjgF/YER057c/UK114 family)